MLDMGLQVRLRHPLGERVVELPERTVDQPAIVGRARDADLQVPSMSVAAQHLGLFIHEGQWVVQPISGTVLLNDQPLADAAMLSVGDVLKLGDGAAAPTLQIDPIAAAEGQSGPVRASPVAAAPRQTQASAWGVPLGAAMPASAPARAPARMPPQAPSPIPAYPQAPPQATQANSWSGEEGDEATIDFNPNPPGETDTRFYLPKKKKTSPAIAIVAGVVSVVVLIVVVVVAHNKAYDPPPKTETVIIQAAPRQQEAGPKKLFDLDGDQAAIRQQRPQEGPRALSPTPPADPDATPSPTPAAASPAPTPAPVPASPPPSNDAMPAPQANRASATPSAQPDAEDAASNMATADEAWRDVLLAHGDIRHQGLSIIKYDDYRRDHPGKFAAELDRFTEDAVNWLYWQHVAQLWKKRDAMAAGIKQKLMDLSGESSAEFRAQVTKDKEDLQTRFDQASTGLKDEMGYTGDTPPDLESPSNLVALAAQRDKEKFSDFKRRVLKYVRANHGAVWWDGD
jgi:hypothetical protein